MPIESPPFQQMTESVQQVQPAVEPLGVEATERPAPAEEDKPGLATETLAELYASQGHLDRALAVYRQLVATQQTMWNCAAVWKSSRCWSGVSGTRAFRAR